MLTNINARASDTQMSPAKELETSNAKKTLFYGSSAGTSGFG